AESHLTQNTPIVPMETPLEQLESLQIEAALQTALEHRPEVLQAKKNLETAGVQTQFAKNQLLPDLSLQGRIGFGGLGYQPLDSYDSLTSTNFYNMGGGVILSYPLG